ncbi:MAG: ABC transporter ATP-binding protein [Gemmatimonadota bacterium]|jgi:Cu-processing system ATP-binding protein
MIRLVGIRKRFGPLDVLRGIDLDIPRGRVAAIVGPNGAGKTTIIKMLLGLVKPDSGRIIWGDHTLNGDWRYRSRVGYMPQIVRFPENLTGRELLEMITDLRGGEAEPDAELIGAFRLEKDLDKPFRTLSGGTRQKVNAAIAFRFRPDLLILDEPTAGLDPVSTRALKEKVRKERDAGRSIVVTSHNMSELEALADDVAFLLDGAIRYRGSLDALKAETGEADLEGAIACLMTREAAT